MFVQLFSTPKARISIAGEEIRPASGGVHPLSTRLPLALRFAGTFLAAWRMKLTLFLLLPLPVLALSGCAAPGMRTDPRDFAVSTCELTPPEIALAQKRAQDYLARYPAVAGDLRLLAVQADYVFPSEVQDLWVKLGRSQTSSSAYLQRRGQSFKLWRLSIAGPSFLPPTRDTCSQTRRPAAKSSRSEAAECSTSAEESRIHRG
jgi:hypothetical protein